VVRAEERGRVELGSVVANGASGLNSVDQIVELGYNNANNIIHSTYAQSTTVNNNQINITREPAGYSWYFGTGSDIANSAGSSTGYVRSLATAGSGNG
jgi:hypothetical protein